MMGVVGSRLRDYRRWEYEDETEIGVDEEQLRLDDHEYVGGRETPTSVGGVVSGVGGYSGNGAPQGNLVAGGAVMVQTCKGISGGGGGSGGRSSRVSMRRRGNKDRGKRDTLRHVKVVCLSAVVLVAGFTAGFSVGVRERVVVVGGGGQEEGNKNTTTADGATTTGGGMAPERGASGAGVRKLFIQLSAEGIAKNLRRMSQEPHRAGSPQGKAMAFAIRDLWRSFGLSVRVEVHKGGISQQQPQQREEGGSGGTRNRVEIIASLNGSVLFSSGSSNANASPTSSSPVLPPPPMIAFSPAGDVNGSLIYARYGRAEDLEYLRNAGVVLNGAVALVRFSSVQPGVVSSVACAYGISGLVFYPDPEDFPGWEESSSSSSSSTATQQQHRGSSRVPPRQRLLHSGVLRWASLVGLDAGVGHAQRHGRGRCSLPAHTVSYGDAEILLRWLGSFARAKRAPSSWQGGLQTPYFVRSSGGGSDNNNNNNASVIDSTTKTPEASVASSQFVRLRTFNTARSGSLLNVVAAIPGAWESDRYVIVGCSHDSWSTGGAGDPGFGLALLTEIAEKFSVAVQKGWRPRRSVLFVSWDGHLQGQAGVSHWLQEHHFEISSRAIAYVDVGRVMRGNETLLVESSPLLREIARKAVGRVARAEAKEEASSGDHERDSDSGGGVSSSSSSSTKFLRRVRFSSLLTPDQPAFAFLGGIGVPWLRFSVTNWRKEGRGGGGGAGGRGGDGDEEEEGERDNMSDRDRRFTRRHDQSFDYPLFSTDADTVDNFLRFVSGGGGGDEEGVAMAAAQTLGTVIAESVLLLSDSAVLPINVEDYVVEVQKAFGGFVAEYGKEMSEEKLSIAYLQAAVMRLEVIGDNFHTDMHNRSVVMVSGTEHEVVAQATPGASRANFKSKKPLLHRMMNDKLMEVDRSLLSPRSTEAFRHQVLGFSNTVDDGVPGAGGSWDWWHDDDEHGQSGAATSSSSTTSTTTFTTDGSASSLRLYFPKLRAALDCGRVMRKGGGHALLGDVRQSNNSNDLITNNTSCRGVGGEWRSTGSQKIASLTRALDATSAVLQSPLLPEESE